MRYLLGNVKKDGNISFEDLIIIQNNIVSITKFPTPEDYIIADINKDGKVSTLELLQIQGYLISRRYNYIYNTINIERGDTIVENRTIPPINPVKISNDFVLEENRAYGLRLYSGLTGNIVYGAYAKEQDIPFLNDSYVSLHITSWDYPFLSDSEIYIYQDLLGGIYLLRYRVNENGSYDLDASLNDLKIEEFYEIKTSD